jgi:UDP-N-acetylmuramate dehydrogenase
LEAGGGSLKKMKKNIKLAPYTSWLIGGDAEFFAEPESVEALKKEIIEAGTNKTPITILGGGTNVLISDDGIKGLVISLKKLSGVEILSKEGFLNFWALGGTTKSELLKTFLKHKLAPAKMLAGLPGQVGGGVVMNAGVSEKLEPREFVEIVEAIEVLRPDGKLEILESKNLKWDYRHCEGWKPGIITRVKFLWPMRPDDKIIPEVKALNLLRLKKQPLEWPSCGSVFRNPLPESAGNLIERAGLKGHSYGGAQISEKHANFIINRGNAKATDIEALMKLCVEEVKKRFSISLRSEVIFLN